MTDYPPEEVLKSFEKHERAAIKAGLLPRERSAHVIPKVCKDFGVHYLISPWQKPHPLISRLENLYSKILRQADRGAGAVFTGIACHLDSFFPVIFPIAYGTCRLNVRDCIEISDEQWSRLKCFPDEHDEFMFQVCDVFDIGASLGCYDDFSMPDGYAGDLFCLSCQYMEAAVAAATGNFRLKGAAQSAIMAAELSIKSAAVVVSDLNETQLQKEIGHKISNAKKFICADPRYDWPALAAQIKNIPELVRNRYDPQSFSRTEARKVIISAQRIIALNAASYSGATSRNKFCVPAP